MSILSNQLAVFSFGAVCFLVFCLMFIRRAIPEKTKNLVFYNVALAALYLFIASAFLSAVLVKLTSDQVEKKIAIATTTAKSVDRPGFYPDSLVIHDFLSGKSVNNDQGAWLIQTSEEEWAPRVQRGLDEIADQLGIVVDISKLKEEIDGPNVQTFDQYFRLVK